MLLTPPAIAQELGVKASRVICWIRAGQLPAVNLAEPTARRPRFKVCPAALAEFLERQAVVPPAPKPKRRQRRQANVTEYF